jgi:hypothetical protein
MLKLFLKAGEMYERMTKQIDKRVAYYKYVLDMIKKDKTEDLYFI